MNPRIAVIVPTVDGREEHYLRCRDAYEREPGVTVYTERNHPTCGAGWQAGAERAEADGFGYIHFTCDDIEPHSGCFTPAIEALHQGFQPAPRVLSPAGDPQYRPAWGQEYPDWTPADISILPFITRELWESAVRPLLTCHYYTDDWISWRAQRAGYPVRVRTGYAFTHHWAQHKRGAGMTEGDRMRHDHGLFFQAQAMAAAGTWDKPWPI